LLAFGSRQFVFNYTYLPIVGGSAGPLSVSCMTGMLLPAAGTGACSLAVAGTS